MQVLNTPSVSPLSLTDKSADISNPRVHCEAQIQRFRVAKGRAGKRKQGKDVMCYLIFQVPILINSMIARIWIGVPSPYYHT